MGKSKRQVYRCRTISQHGRPSRSSTCGRQSSRSQPPIAIARSNTPVSTSSIVLPVTTSTVSHSLSALSSLSDISMDQLLAIIPSEIDDRSCTDQVATGPLASSSIPMSLPVPIPTAAPHGELHMHCYHVVILSRTIHHHALTLSWSLSSWTLIAIVRLSHISVMPYTIIFPECLLHVTSYA